MGTWINVVLIILLIYFVAAKMLPTKGVEHITPDELKEKLKQTKDRQFIDVRTPAEYRARNIRQFKIWLSNVVFPEPKYPLNTVTGIFIMLFSFHKT